MTAAAGPSLPDARPGVDAGEPLGRMLGRPFGVDEGDRLIQVVINLLASGSGNPSARRATP